MVIGAKDWKMSESGKLVVPEVLKEELVIRIHEEIGHASRDGTYNKIKELSYDLTLREVRNVLQKCKVCSQHNAGRRAKRKEILSIKSRNVWGIVGMDVAGPLSVRGKSVEKYFIVLVDSKSGYAMKHCCRLVNANSVKML
ncbi:MAG: integrase zinc binding domain-containing protein, partial [Cetobacterium sp.]